MRPPSTTTTVSEKVSQSTRFHIGTLGPYFLVSAIVKIYHPDKNILAQNYQKHLTYSLNKCTIDHRARVLDIISFHTQGETNENSW
jgi:hypothetical protein